MARTKRVASDHKWHVNIKKRPKRVWKLPPPPPPTVDPGTETDSAESAASGNPDYDVGATQPVVGSPSDADVMTWGWRVARFIRSPAGIESQWIGKRPLGEGSFGIAGLWEKSDEDGRVLEVCHASVSKISKSLQLAANGH